MSLKRLLVLWALLTASAGAFGQALEQQVKAAFLFRFLSFIEWSPQALGAPGTPLVITVMEADDVHAELQKIVAGRAVAERPVVVRRVADGDAPGPSHVLFVGRRAAAHLPRLARTPGLLLVAETEGALEHGALINFVLRDERVRFEVAPDEAERRGLRIGARVLAVALRVRPGSARP